MSFDLLAPHYRWMEALAAGGKLQRCRIAFLDTLPAPRRVLIYGDGNGRFLAALCQRFPAVQVVSVDSSQRMIELARERLQQLALDSSRVEWVHADALAWTPPPGQFDLIVTHFFLDCFREDQLRDLMPVIARSATPHAHWLLADFKVAESGFRRLRSRLILAGLYVFFRHVTRLPAQRLTPPGPLLEAAGFVLQQRQEINWGLLHSDWWSR